MKKKKVKTPLAGADTSHKQGPQTSAPVSLEAARKAAHQYIDSEQWDALHQFIALDPRIFGPDDHLEAANFQLRLRVWAAAKGERDLCRLPRESQTAIEGWLQTLVDSSTDLHLRPYLAELYFQSMGFSTKKLIAGFQLLVKAHAAFPNLWLALRFRGVCLKLLRQKEEAWELNDQDAHLLGALPDIYGTLGDCYSRLDEQENSERDELCVTALKLDLESRMAEPWDYGRVASSIASIPKYVPDETNLGFTPQEWAFMWELQYAQRHSFADLLARYPEEFHCDAAQGLRLLVQASIAPSDTVDSLVTRALSNIMGFGARANEPSYENLLVSTSNEGATLISHFGAWNIPEVESLLCHVVESMPEDFKRHEELQSLYRIYSASASYGTLEDEDDSDECMAGLQWLCDQSLAFQLMAAEVVDGAAGRLVLLLEGLRRSAATELDGPYGYFPEEIDAEAFDEAKVPKVLAALRALVPVRSQMLPQTEVLWMSLVVGIFSVLCTVKNKALLKDVLAVAHEFKDDLLAKKAYFRLAYLEQLAGDSDNALRYYLYDLEQRDSPLLSVIQNVEALLTHVVDIDQAQGLVDTLAEFSKGHRHRSTVAQFTQQARAHLSLLKDKDQFERTAVNRWPTLTAQARQLLTVLENINTYSNLKQLGECANMDEMWVRRHLQKLKDTGMVFDTETGYRINPHIQPLLKQESQHSVVGKIIRANGTTAVKQVFNSGREFSIYQILVQLCPNHLVFPNCALQSIMTYERMKELVDDDVFGYYLRASVDVVVVSSTTYLPMLAIEVDSVWHDTERQQKNDTKKDLLFATAGIPFLRLRPVGSPSAGVIRGQVAEHLDELVRAIRPDLPGYAQARLLVEDLSGVKKELTH